MVHVWSLRGEGGEHLKIYTVACQLYNLHS